ncbi:MAG: preprotein translocase subunit YajC [Lachnospiraceae bacterium]|nr:preprotein translocase subunit YajC [Lachnospiraceae bacterium]
MFLSSSGSSTSMISIIALYVVIFAVMYFLLIRPQKKQQKAMKELISRVEAGDSVLTTSGFYGVVLDVMEDTVIVEFGNNKNCRIPMKKEAISAIEKPDIAKTTEE